MSDNDEFRRVAEIERAANGKPSLPNGRGVLCPDARGCNGGIRKRVDWCRHFAWNSKPKILSDVTARYHRSRDER